MTKMVLQLGVQPLSLRTRVNLSEFARIVTMVSLPDSDRQ